ncbi:meprin A subunit beta-like [Nematolebias whitei]|uniref:meprin A subunit beta-like n=1 Tax=Nematolebias whitei TaxID=451745 RepID=UPI00189B1E9E|nr:meprin A subunit beta-like [Nematolebias whitei]
MTGRETEHDTMKDNPETNDKTSRLAMEVKGFIIFMVNLVVSSVLANPMPNTRSSIIDPTKLWTSPVSYVLDKSLDMNAKGVILRALDQFRLKSCIDFKVWESEKFYLNLQKFSGCWSYVGQTFANGQDLSIGAGCDIIGIAEHEILHALGFYHEQSRYDRDDYVQIVLNNIIKGYESNFDKISSAISSTHGTPYDYLSVMHYDKNAFTNGNGSTIITIDPKYQDVIGQRLDMSPLDVEELNLLYNCNSSIAFMLYCGFSNGTTCSMDQCSQNGKGWEVVTQVSGGPSSDHTSLPSGSGNINQELGYFIHASTALGQEGDSSQLNTQRMSPKRGCNVQCLQFYYFHSGNESDQLNIWIREFQNDQDTTGMLRLVGQITGSPTSHWKLHYVSLNATKQFQVMFEVRKGAGRSTGGFSVDDINLSETECPHVFIQIDDFENLLSTSPFGTALFSPRQYSKEGYAYRAAAVLYNTFVGLYVQLLSGDYDGQLQWPCVQKQINFQLLDQNPTIQQQMSKQLSFVSDETQVISSGTLVWSNPRVTGQGVFYENAELVYGGPLFGYSYFAFLNDLQSRESLKGGSAVFTFNFEDFTPLVNGSALPCRQARPVNIKNPPSVGSCTPRSTTTVSPPPKTTNNSISAATSPHPITTNNSISTATSPSPTTTNNSISTSTSPTPKTTNSISTATSPPPTTTNNSITIIIRPPPPTTNNSISISTSPYPKTTNNSITIITRPPPPTTNNSISNTTSLRPPTSTNRILIINSTPLTTTDNRTSSNTSPPPTTDNRLSTTTSPPPPTTKDDRSIFGFAPAVVSSPFLILLLTLLFLVQ